MSEDEGHDIDIALALGTLAMFIALWTITRHWAPWADEAHALDTVRLYYCGP